MIEPCRCPLCKAAPWLAGVLVALTACVQRPPELTQHERAAVHAARQAWAARGDLPLDTGDCDFGAISIRRPATATEFHQLCKYWGSAAACQRLEGAPIGGADWPVIVLYPGQLVEEDGNVVCHEMAHLLARCAGMPDNGHADARLWQKAGGEESVQQRCRAIVRGEP